MTVLSVPAARGQNKTASVHEVTPFLGFYAPDRFETSMAFGLRYYYQIDQRYSVGGIIGFARSKQDYLRRTNNLNLLPGSDRVFYNGARATNTFLNGKVEPYVLLHLGLTRLYDENSFTYGFGLGAKITLNPRLAFRYEFANYIFSSGRDLNNWTNKNLEVSMGAGYAF
ncbi:MAG: outer membrane beta-barrel protein [candidate division KSB1 bacterium]|nr:outer membrane beta-barrel protein [candidate division KSB1 bacterium]